ncbi:hypothetical protein K435DRAFT_872623 [Dendrothele bispora CBS 962.96]|uniref:Uncharacterized protein n=1 Tax=Dendrothele bispora (strain CBS 962.96) TaxID=1314807 RepID=A0A4S8L184_DENBC|nr:hypothetical protein K435DRAFT_872623 [Dendrothele bispora CBS 962.96]
MKGLPAEQPAQRRSGSSTSSDPVIDVVPFTPDIQPTPSKKRPPPTRKGKERAVTETSEDNDHWKTEDGESSEKEDSSDEEEDEDNEPTPSSTPAPKKSRLPGPALQKELDDMSTSDRRKKLVELQRMGKDDFERANVIANNRALMAQAGVTATMADLSTMFQKEFGAGTGAERGKEKEKKKGKEKGNEKEREEREEDGRVLRRSTRRAKMNSPEEERQDKTQKNQGQGSKAASSPSKTRVEVGKAAVRAEKPREEAAEMEVDEPEQDDEMEVDKVLPSSPQRGIDNPDSHTPDFPHPRKTSETLELL